VLCCLYLVDFDLDSMRKTTGTVVHEAVHPHSICISVARDTSGVWRRTNWRTASTV
jgi:hypothetical protein